MSTEPDSLILQLLREMRADMATKGDVAAVRSDFDDLKADFRSLRADVASDIVGVQSDIQKARKDLGEQIVGLRRVEQHLNLPEAQ